MKYEIRKYKELRTREGYACTFTLYVDGQPACTVEDRGDGGSTWIDWRISGATRMWEPAGSRLATQVLAYVATLPPLTDPKYPPLPMDLELWLGTIAEEHVNNRRFTRLCKTKTVFRCADDEPGTWRVASKPYSAPFGAQLRREFAGKTVEIFNERGA